MSMLNFFLRTRVVQDFEQDEVKQLMGESIGPSQELGFGTMRESIGPSQERGFGTGIEIAPMPNVITINTESPQTICVTPNIRHRSVCSVAVILSLMTTPICLIVSVFTFALLVGIIFTISFSYGFIRTRSTRFTIQTRPDTLTLVVKLRTWCATPQVLLTLNLCNVTEMRQIADLRSDTDCPYSLRFTLRNGVVTFLQFKDDFVLYGNEVFVMDFITMFFLRYRQSKDYVNVCLQTPRFRPKLFEKFGKHPKIEGDYITTSTFWGTQKCHWREIGALYVVEVEERLHGQTRETLGSSSATLCYKVIVVSTGSDKIVFKARTAESAANIRLALERLVLRNKVELAVRVLLGVEELPLDLVNLIVEFAEADRENDDDDDELQ